MTDTIVSPAHLGAEAGAIRKIDNGWELRFERVEVLRPEMAIAGQPQVEVLQRGGIEAVKPPLGVLANVHQPGLAQDREMLRDGRLADRQGVDEVAGGAFAVGQHGQDRHAVGFGQGGEGDVHVYRLTAI